MVDSTVQAKTKEKNVLSNNVWRLTGAMIIGLFAQVSVAAANCDLASSPPDAQTATAVGNAIVSARYTDATERYAHAVLGDAIEAGGLAASADPAAPCQYYIVLGEDSVFEDVTPRIADVTGDGKNDVIVIESQAHAGASLAVYGLNDSGEFGKLASTPYIGRAYRWLAPAGIADFNADGVLDVAFVQTPHIGGILRIWSFRDGKAEQLAFRPGFSNHRIGERTIAGGLRVCDGEIALVLPSASWQATLAATVNNAMEIEVREVAENAESTSIATALIC